MYCVVESPDKSRLNFRRFYYLLLEPHPLVAPSLEAAEHMEGQDRKQKAQRCRPEIVDQLVLHFRFHDQAFDYGFSNFSNQREKRERKG